MWRMKFDGSPATLEAPPSPAVFDHAERTTFPVAGGGGAPFLPLAPASNRREHSKHRDLLLGIDPCVADGAQVRPVITEVNR